MSITRGTIFGTLSTVPDLDAALLGYRDILGFELVECGLLSADLAESWRAPATAGARHAVLRPASGEPFWMRLVEQPDHPDFAPARTYGWAAWELTVRDVFGWPKRLAGSAFEIVGPPKAIANMEPAFIPMQVLGPGREMVYLNEVLADMPNLDLPRAGSAVDRAFIVILATPDREATVAWYESALGLSRSDSFTIPYTMINRAFALPADHLTSLTMVAFGRMPVIEVDDYPPLATTRPAHAGMLPPGNALVTLAVTDLDVCRCEWLAPPARIEAAPYLGRRAATTLGPVGELVELIETA